MRWTVRSKQQIGGSRNARAGAHAFARQALRSVGLTTIAVLLTVTLLGATADRSGASAKLQGCVIPGVAVLSVTSQAECHHLIRFHQAASPVVQHGPVDSFPNWLLQLPPK